MIYNTFEKKVFLLHPTNVSLMSEGIRIKKSKHKKKFQSFVITVKQLEADNILAVDLMKLENLFILYTK